jgi:hypothetical protein
MGSVTVPDPTNAERQRRYRERQAGRLPAPQKLTCAACNGGSSGRYGSICQRCWLRLTPEGRASLAARQAKFQAQAKGQESAATAQSPDDHSLV